MDARHRHHVHGALALLGIVVLIGGLLRDRRGAVVAGLIVAAINGQLWQRGRRPQGSGPVR